MRAIRYHDYGGPEALQLDEVPEPSPGPRQLRVRVLAASVNPIDWKLASGKYRAVLPVPRPAIPTFDLVGEVLELGSGVEGFTVGQRIAARQLGADNDPGGASAEQALVDLAVAAAVPEGVSTEDAAALPLAGMTALQALRDACGMRMQGEDRRVLVVGASGGVGHYAVQLAHQAGAHVTAVCSGRNADFVRELGADVVLDYRQQDHLRSDAPYAIALDAAGQASWARFKEVLEPKGALAQPNISPAWMARGWMNRTFGGPEVHVIRLKSNAADLSLLLGMMAEGRLRSVVGATLPWTELAEAWRMNQKGGVRGKIVLTG